MWVFLRKRSGFFVLWGENMMKKNICTALKNVVVKDEMVHSIQYTGYTTEPLENLQYAISCSWYK